MSADRHIICRTALKLHYFLFWIVLYFFSSFLSLLGGYKKPSSFFMAYTTATIGSSAFLNLGLATFCPYLPIGLALVIIVS